MFFRLQCDYRKNRNENGLALIGVCVHFGNHYFGNRLVIYLSFFSAD